MTYYIDFDSGSNTNNGTSQSTPWKHAPGDTKATGNPASKTIIPGDTFIFKGGVVYLGGFTISTSGTTDNPITFDGNSAGTWGTGRAIIDREYLDQGVCIQFAPSISHVIIKNFELRHAGGWADNDPVVTGANNETPITKNTGGHGIDLHRGGNSHILIENIYAHRLGGWRNTAGWQRNVIQGCGVVMLNANSITIRGCEFTKVSRGVGIYAATTTSNITVENCNMHNYVMWCIDLSANATGAAISNITFRKNKMYNYAEFDVGNWGGVSGQDPHTNGIFLRKNWYDSTWDNVRIYENRFWCDDHGNALRGGTACIFISSGPSAIIYNNIIDSDSKTRGISIAYANSNTQKQVVRVYNNTIRTRGAVAVDYTNEPNSAKREIYIQNNLILQAAGTQANWTYLYNVDNSSATVLNNNIYYSVGWNELQKYILAPSWSRLADIRAAGFEANGLYTDPLLTSLTDSPVGQNDYKLLENSPAIGRGANLSVYFNTDSEGKVRPASGPWDIGATSFIKTTMSQHFYIAQTQLGNGDGLSAANAKSVDWFNNFDSWRGTKEPGRIGPGDTIHLVGTISTTLTVRSNGTADAPITLLWEKGAKLSAPYWVSGSAIDAYNRHYIIFDGGAESQIGGYKGNPLLANGIIECTDNGTNLTHKVPSQIGIRCAMGTGITVKNLVIRNLFVRVRGDSVGGGNGITNQNVNTGTVRDFTVTNCIIHDVHTGIDTDYGTNVGNYRFSFNTIYHVNWGGRCGNRNNTSTSTDSIDGIFVHDNYFHTFDNWDHPNNNYHHNGFFIWAHGASTVRGARLYNNVIHGPFTDTSGGWPNNATSALFVVGNGIREAKIYNNLIIDRIGGGPAGGLLELGSGTDGQIEVYNNTLVGPEQASGGILLKVAANGNGAFTYKIRNNIFFGKTAISKFFTGNLTIESDNNIFYNLPPTQNFNFSNTSSSSFKTYAQWQSLGYDLNSRMVDPLLDAEFKLKEGSPAIGTATDLSTIFNFDIENKIREGAWDLAAYAFDKVTTPPTPTKPEHFYVSQNQLGNGSGIDHQNTKDLVWLNTATNWSGTEVMGKICPGDTIHLVGAFTSTLTVQGHGTPEAKITIVFETGAKFSAPYFTGSAINMVGKHNITIDGNPSGVIGGTNGDELLANGVIECTDNGTNLANKVNCSGISARQCNNLTIRGLVIRNIFVRVIGSDPVKYGSGIHHAGENADYKDFLVENCIISHASTGIGIDYNQTSARYTFQDNTIHNVNWGIGGGNRGTASLLDTVIVARNKIYDFTNWDGTDSNSQGSLHHNGIYFWGISGTSRFINVKIYGNIVGPGYGAHSTSAIFLVSNSNSEAMVYNNLLIAENDTATNGLITIGLGDNSKVYVDNNTFIGKAAGIAINIGANRSPSGFLGYVRNNLSVNKTFAFFSYGFTASSVNNNLVFAPPANKAYAIGSSGSGTFLTFEQWKNLGYDLNGIYGIDPLLDINGNISQNSPAIGAGQNLSVLFTDDIEGVVRVSAWDIGAFSYSGVILPPPEETAPIITAQPIDITVVEGSQVSFSVSATGNPLPSYQWRKNAVNIAGATNNVFAIESATLSDSANYDVIVTNTKGSVQSQLATLIVTESVPEELAPQITEQPQNATVNENSSVSLSVSATGNPVPICQWHKDGAAISGANSFTLNIISASMQDQGNYYAVVSNSKGNVTSNTVSITVIAVAPLAIITKQPVGQSVSEGADVTLTVVATSPTPMTYQWDRNGIVLAGKTHSSLMLSNVRLSDTGTYSVTITNTGGSVVSDGAALTVSSPQTPPVITVHPISRIVRMKDTVAFHVAASGIPTPTYQWYKDGSPIWGATSTSFFISNVRREDAGIYAAIASNSLGMAVSNNATLTVNNPRGK